MQYNRLKIVTAITTLEFNMPEASPVVIDFWAKKAGEGEEKHLTTIHIVFPQEEDIVWSVSQSGELSM